jgi:hypothetical protein
VARGDPDPQRHRPDSEPQRWAEVYRLAVNPGVHWFGAVTSRRGTLLITQIMPIQPVISHSAISAETETKIYETRQAGLRPSPASHVRGLRSCERSSGRCVAVTRCVPLWTACGGGWPCGLCPTGAFDDATRSAADVLSEHVAFEVECIDRMYLNVYVPQLQYATGLVSYIHRQLGMPVASTVALAPVTEAFTKAMRAFAADRQIPWVDFARGQRKDDVAHEYLAAFTATEGMLFIGRAQEKVPLFRTRKRRRADGSQVREPGGHHRVVRQRGPYRPPGGQPQGGAAAPGDRGLALVATGGVVARAQPGVLDQRPRGGEPGRVAGLGQDRRRADRGEPGDRRDQGGQLKVIEDGDHAGLGVGQPLPGVLPVAHGQVCALEGAGAVRGHPSGIGQGGEDGAHDPQARPGRAPGAAHGAPRP